MTRIRHGFVAMRVGDRPQGVAGDCNSLAETHAWFDSRVAHHATFIQFFCILDGKSSGSLERVLYIRHTSVYNIRPVTLPYAIGTSSQRSVDYIYKTLTPLTGYRLAPIKQFAKCAITLQFKIARNDISNRQGHRICRCLFQVQTRQNPHSAKAFILRTSHYKTGG